VTTISVVTPTLNARRYLPACLASLAAQAPAAVEHLVVDGGSTDGTRELVGRHGTAILLDRPGLNQAAAINAGFRTASGEVLAWLNADDAYAAEALPTVAGLFGADPTLDVLIGDCVVVGPSGELLWCERPGPYDFERLLRRGNYLAQPSVFVRRQVLAAVGLLDESLEFAMDYDLWLRLRGARARYVPQVLAAFRWHAASKTARNTLGNWRESVRVRRRYGGGWTPYLAWTFGRALLSVAKGAVMDGAPARLGRAAPALARPVADHADSSGSRWP
jgi:glycosyltransferase involved in cell wall biosynthesis